MFKRLAGLAAAFLLCATTAHAADYRIDFAATNFVPSCSLCDVKNPAPYDSAVGYAILSADSLGSNWTALKAFDLTIGDVHYTMSNVSADLFGGEALIGGALSGANQMDSHTNDFFMIMKSSRSYGFEYASEAVSGFWLSRSLVQTVTAVPEPGTYAMLLAGLCALGVAARRRKA